MSRFAVVPELKVGSVVEVAGDAIRIEIDAGLTELTRTHAGDVYPVGQCGSILKLHSGRRILFAYVNVLRMRSEIAFEEGTAAPPVSEDARMIEATLIAEGRWNESKVALNLDRGIATYPQPGQAAYLTTLSELTALYGAPDASVRHRIELGEYVGANNAKCYANLDKLVGLHTAVLGSTGAGKSGTVAAIIRAMLDSTWQETNKALRPRIVLIDPHGEYPNAFKNQCVVYQAYSSASEEPAQADTLPLRLPYWLMSGEEFRDLVIGKTEREATSENNIVLKALRHSRLVSRGLIEAARNDWGKKAVDSENRPQDDRPRNPGDKADLEVIASYDRDTPDHFSLAEFRMHIQYELALRDTRGEWTSLSTSDRRSHDSILDKLAVLESDPRLQFMMADSQAPEVDGDLDAILEQFVGDLSAQVSGRQADIRIVDISGLPNEVAGPLTAAIARILFQYKVWQTRLERERDPVMLVCEEAHRYVPNAGLAEYESAQKAIRRLAKEGRKYGIGMLLVSQRPADVEGTVLSQCNSWIVLRLTNSVDQSHVKRFLPDNLAGLAALLPSLSRQEAIFVGDAASLPARIRIRTLPKNQLPDSNDISYAKGWSQPPVSRDTIRAVVKRWRHETDEPVQTRAPKKRAPKKKS